VNSSLSGYLFRSVHNACINYLQRVKEKNKTSLVDDFTVIELKLKNPYSEEYPIGNIFAKELEEQLNCMLLKNFLHNAKKFLCLAGLKDYPTKKLQKS
jgi:DNA-directed RNA polymerase specialized sigma24 family protein